jgi:hypothetical protein
MADRLVRILCADGATHTFIADELVTDQMRNDFKALAIPQSYDVVVAGYATIFTIDWSQNIISALIVEDTGSPAGGKDFRLILLPPSGVFVSALGCSYGQVLTMSTDMENQEALPQEYQVAANTTPLGAEGVDAKLIVHWPRVVGVQFISVVELPPE